MISVVAPAGGCAAWQRIISAPVAARDNAAAPTRAIETPAAIAGGASCSPKIHSAAYPQTMPIAWPKIVCLGDEAGERGEKKNRNAVGPSDGKMNGVWEIIATAANNAIVMKPFRNMKSAQMGRSECPVSRCVN